MEKLISKLSSGHALTEETARGLANERGLDKLTALYKSEPAHIYYLYAVYLGERLALVKLRAHLLAQTNDKLDSTKRLQVVNGAITAVKTNAYKLRDCYKCQTKNQGAKQSCDRCAGTGKTASKPKEHELCSFKRWEWYDKANKAYRDQYEHLIGLLFSYDAELRQLVNDNSRNN